MGANKMKKKLAAAEVQTTVSELRVAEILGVKPMEPIRGLILEIG